MAEANTAAGTDGLAIVHIAQGEMSGAGGAVKVFRGIPYAAPAVGERRWRAPLPLLPWSGVRAMTDWGDDCPQASASPSISRAPRQSEDCLNLNVWTPAQDPGERLPVMVWLYGGSFLYGSASDAKTDGDSFARKGVVLVTVNYRVGVFGFLAHPALSAETPEQVSGNYGVLDILAALAWVRDNIAAFGGDPGRVTLFGVSAGAALVSLLMTSPLAEGLFQRAILESPGAMRPLAGLADAEAAGKGLGDDIAALRGLTWQAALARTGELVPRMRGLTTPRVLRPIRDGWVIPEDDRAAFQGGRFLAVPAIVGTNADEGSRFVATWPVASVADWQAVVAENFGDSLADAAVAYPAATDAEARRRLGELFADTQFDYGAFGVARALARRQPKTWRYRFTRRPPQEPDGPHHGDEVRYVFQSFDAPGGSVVYDEADRRLAMTMQDAWVRFAETGDPNGPGLPDWPRYDAADNYLTFDTDIAVGSGWRRPQLDFLDRLYDTRTKP